MTVLQHAHHLLRIDPDRIVTVIEEYDVLNRFVSLPVVTNNLVQPRIICIRRENELLSVQIIRNLEQLEIFGGDAPRFD